MIAAVMFNIAGGIQLSPKCGIFEECSRLRSRIKTVECLSTKEMQESYNKRLYRAMVQKLERIRLKFT